MLVRVLLTRVVNLPFRSVSTLDLNVRDVLENVLAVTSLQVIQVIKTEIL